MTAPTTTQLKAEIQNDPAALGYAPFVAANDFLGAANLINAVNAAISIKRPDVMAAEVLQAVDVRDVAFPNVSAVPAASQPLATAWFTAVLALSRIQLVNNDGTDTTALKNIKLLLVSGGQGSQARLNALAVRPGSRAESLWGAGVVVSGADIANALVS